MKNQAGYVALEFVLAMGLLVLPTALILLQIPSVLEQHNRLDSVASIISNNCANNAHSISEGNSIAEASAQREIESSTSLKHARLKQATCSFENGSIDYGQKVTSNISIEIPGLVIPGSEFGKTWTISSSHTSYVPKYRGIND